MKITKISKVVCLVAICIFSILLVPLQGLNGQTIINEDFETFTLLQTIGSCENTFPYPQGNGWTQSSYAESYWRANTGPTPTNQTGPSGDHTTGSGVYLYYEASGCDYRDASLESPTINMDSIKYELQFAYHLYGTDFIILYVDFFDGNFWQNGIWQKSGNQGDQ